MSPHRIFIANTLLLSIFSIASLLAPRSTTLDAQSSARQRVEKLAVDAAKAGLERVANACVEQVIALGASERSLEQLNKRIQKSGDKAKGEPSERDLKRLAKAAESAAESVVKAATSGADEIDLELCRIALALDSNVESAHRALGHVQSDDGAWHSAEMAQLLSRKLEIAHGLQRANALQPEVEIVEAIDPTLIDLYGDEASAVIAEGLRIESNISPERLAEVMRATLKAMAFGNWLQSDELTPNFVGGMSIHLPNRAMYHQYIDKALAAGRIPNLDVQQIKSQGGYWFRGDPASGFNGQVSAGYSPIGEIGGILIHYFDRSIRQGLADSPSGDTTTPHWLKIGHHNYISLLILGCKTPELLESQTSDRTRSDLSDTELKLSNAGLVGCRSWLSLLVREGRAPSLARCVVDQSAKIHGDLLLRATASVEFLHELDSMQDVSKRCRKLWIKKPSGHISLIERTESVLAESIVDFDERWERWILGETDQVSVRELLYLNSNIQDGPAADMFETLNARRSAAGLNLVEVDSELSRGAAQHAAYLEIHPEQKTAWPDAHEEYPESEGFTPTGSWAGSHSVIAFNGAQSAIDEWLGTFYHRVPLTHPGLLRVGLGSVRDTCVLDCTSLSDPTGAYEGHYPFNEQRNVPRRFVPELPNPVPEREDQRTLGYPITYQIGPNWSANDLKLTLWLNGEEVECFYSTPTSPTNPLLAPENCYCLMPKQPLEANSNYEVRVDGPGAIEAFSFRTGK